MKKFLFSIALSAAMFCSFNAEAQTVPNWYNFQGIAAEYKSQEVAVTFEVVDEAGKAVYTETANVTTTEQGAFTHKLGTGASQDDWMFGIDWTASEYSLVVSVNGKQLCKAAFGAVPYATVAESVLGFDVQEYGELAATVKGLTAQTNENNEAIVNLQDGLVITQEDVMNLTLGNKENKAAIADIQETMWTYSDMERYTENLQMSFLSKEDYYADKYEIDAEMEIVTSDIQGIQEKIRGLATVSSVEELADGLEITQEDVKNLTEGNKENKAAIADIQETMWTYSDMERYTENLQMSFLSKEDYYADKYEIDAEMEIVTSDIQGIQEKIRGLATVSSVEELADGLDNTQTDVMNLTTANTERKAEIDELKQTLARYGENMDYLTPLINDLIDQVQALQAEVEALKAAAAE